MINNGNAKEFAWTNRYDIEILRGFPYNSQQQFKNLIELGSKRTTETTTEKSVFQDAKNVFEVIVDIGRIIFSTQDINASLLELVHLLLTRTFKHVHNIHCYKEHIIAIFGEHGRDRDMLRRELFSLFQAIHHDSAEL